MTTTEATTMERVRRMNRNEFTKTVKTALRNRSGKAWSVTGGTGTAYGWVTITSPKSRQIQGGYMSPEDIAELASLLKTSVHPQGVNIPSQSDYYAVFLDRAEGREPTTTATPNWD